MKYVVRAESSDPSGEQNIPGTISIGSEDQARRSIEKNEPRATEEKKKNTNPVRRNPSRKNRPPSARAFHGRNDLGGEGPEPRAFANVGE